MNLALDPAPLCQPTTAREVQTALRSPATRRVLHETVAGLLPPGPPPLTFRLQRVKCKPGRKLTVTYDLAVGLTPGRPVTVTWFAPDHFEPASEAVDQGLEDEACRRGVAQPFRRLSTTVPELGLRIQVSPYDPEFGQLVRLVDPHHVGAMLDRTLGGRWGRPSIASVRFRPGQRHVLRYRGRGRHAATLFAKLERGDRPPRSGAAAAMAAVLAGPEAGVTVVPALALVEADRVVLWAEQPGSPLSQLIRRGASVTSVVGRVGGALRRLHGASAARFADLPVRDLDGEMRVTRRAAGHLGRLLPELGERVEQVLDRVATDRVDAGPAVVSHGDLKADHLLVTDHEVSLIDFDSCASAEPALDLGKFLADLRYWFAAAGRPGLEPAQRAFLAGYGDDGTAEARARSYEAVFLARAAARRVSLADDDWEARTTALVATADSLLGERVG